MKEWINGREEVTRATTRDSSFGTEGIDREGINLDLGYHNINLVTVTEHIHDKSLSPDTAPLFEGEPGFPQNQSPPVPTPHNEVNVVRGMQRSRMGISRSRSGFSRK